MMKKNYYVSLIRQSNGDFEVHEESCTWLPKPENRQYLGSFYTCAEAVAEAKKYYSQVNGCFYCSRPCHTS